LWWQVTTGPSPFAWLSPCSLEYARWHLLPFSTLPYAMGTSRSRWFPLKTATSAIWRMLSIGATPQGLYDPTHWQDSCLLKLKHWHIEPFNVGERPFGSLFVERCYHLFGLPSRGTQKHCMELPVHEPRTWTMPHLLPSCYVFRPGQPLIKPNFRHTAMIYQCGWKDSFKQHRTQI